MTSTSTPAESADTPKTGGGWADIELHPELLKAVADLGWREPLYVQAKALPTLLTESSNLVAQAPTGKGKTGAFALGIIQRLYEDHESAHVRASPLRAVVVCPTRELAVQTKQLQFDPLCKHTKFKVMLALKDSYDKKSTECFSPDIIIGTPGVLLNLVKNQRLNVSNVRTVVIDEADFLILKDSRASKSKGSLSIQQQTLKLKSMFPKSASVWLFSATYSKAALLYARRMAPHSHEVILQEDDEQKPAESVAQFVVHTNGADEKFEVLKKFYELMDVGNVLIFCNQIKDVQYLYQRLSAEIGVAVGEHHSRMEPAQRDENIQRFRKGELTVLVCTDVLGRGVDIPIVNFVVNYEPPTMDFERLPDIKEFIHRVGRAGRVDRQGVALSFTSTEGEKQTLDAIFKSYPNFNVTTLEGAEDPDFVTAIINLKKHHQ